jgi:hypothetical protein
MLLQCLLLIRVLYNMLPMSTHSSLRVLDDDAEWGWAIMCLWSGSGQAAARGRCTPGVTESARYPNLTQNDSEPSDVPVPRPVARTSSWRTILQQAAAGAVSDSEAETRHCPQARSHSDRPGTQAASGARTRDPPGLLLLLTAARLKTQGSPHRRQACASNLPALRPTGTGGCHRCLSAC